MTVVLILSGLSAGALAADTLVDGFVRPPDSAKPWVYWCFMGGNLTREGMTADLETGKQPASVAGFFWR